MTPSKTLFSFCIFFIFGIELQSFVKIPQVFVWGIFVLALVAILVPLILEYIPNFKALKFGIYSIGGFFLLFLVLGITRMQISEFTIINDKLSKLNDGPEKITITGHIISEPNVKDTSQTLKVKVDGISSVVLVTMDRYPEYRYLD